MRAPVAKAAHTQSGFLHSLIVNWHNHKHTYTFKETIFIVVICKLFSKSPESPLFSLYFVSEEPDFLVFGLVKGLYAYENKVSVSATTFCNHFTFTVEFLELY